MRTSFDAEWVDSQRTKPQIQVLEIQHRDQPDGDPVVWLLVERQETYRRDPRDDKLYEASIHISYQRITARYSRRDGGQGRFNV